MREPLPADMFDELCPSSLNPIRFGDKWSALVIRCLEHGPRRFSDLRVPLHRVTAKVLTQTLRSLERDGLITHTPLGEYELSPLGRSILEPMAHACAWTQTHWGRPPDRPRVLRHHHPPQPHRLTGRCRMG